MLLAAAMCVLAGVCASAAAAPRVQTVSSDWTQFGYDSTRRNAGPAATGITRASVAAMQRQEVPLGGTVDSSPIFVRSVPVGGAKHDLFVVTTTFGKAFAIDAATGAVLWAFTPSGYESWAGTARITTSSPALDPNRRFVYSAAPDGRIHKLSVSTGDEVRTGGWPTRVTLDSEHEKLGTSLNISGRYVVATTGGFPGDIPPYQGHVVTIDRQSGRTVNVWYALCNTGHELKDPTSCVNPRSPDVLFGGAVWARAGAVIQPGTGNILVATGNGEFDGHTRWGMSVAMLSPNARRLLRYWTPSDWKKLSAEDEDIGSTAPALLTKNLVVQGGKDAKLRLLDVRRMHKPPSVGRAPVLGGELQTLPAPANRRVFTAPAVWRTKRGIWLFVTTSGGTAGYVLQKNRLRLRWSNSTAGTSPVVAGNLLYAYDWNLGALNVYVPTSGKLVASLPAGRGHWNTPIVTAGRIALGQEDANAHVTFGVLNIYRLP